MLYLVYTNEGDDNMGTRSTVKFYEENQNLMSLYQQYDGYVSGVGNQLVNLFEKYTIVNGLGRDTENIANGFNDLVLMYILDNKEGAGNIYATTETDEQEYNYSVYGGYNSYDLDTIRVKVSNSYDGLLFEGTAKEFIEFVKNS